MKKSLWFSLFFALVPITADYANADPLVYQQTGADLAFAKYGLTGKGVIVAVLDRGIQWQHPDFINPDGTTRIKYMLDMSGQNGCSANNPAPVEYSAAQINAALAGTGPTIPERDAVGHGTATIGMAAGNGRAAANGKYVGIAPEADLIVVKLTSDGAPAHDNQPAEASFVACYTQALQWLDQKITALGEPAVALINSGVQLWGPTDGTSILSRTVDQYFSNRPGRAFVFGSGDEGGLPTHAGGTFSGTQPTVVNFTRSSTAGSAMALWYSGAANAKITITTSAGLTVGPVGPSNTASGSDASGAAISVTQYVPGQEFNPTTSTSGDHFVYISVAGYMGAGTISIAGATGTDAGKFNIYADAAAVDSFTSNLVPGRIAEFAATRSATVTGAFTLRTTYVDIDGVTRTISGDTLNALWSGSSDGPTRDGRLGVSLASPGENTMTSYATNSYWATARFNLAQDGGGYVGRASATSGASPIATGALALLLQMDPNLTSEMARTYLERTAMKDNFTGRLTNYSWGYGKLNIFGALELLEACPAAVALAVPPHRLPGSRGVCF